MKHIKIFFLSAFLLALNVLLACSHSLTNKSSSEQNTTQKKVTSVSFYRDTTFTVVQECSDYLDPRFLPDCKPGQGLKSVRVPYKDFVSSYKDYLFSKTYVSSDWERELDYTLAGLSPQAAKTKVSWENFYVLVEQIEYLTLEIETRSTPSKEFFRLKSRFQKFKNQTLTSKEKLPSSDGFNFLRENISQLIELLPHRTQVVFSPLKNDFGFRFLQSFLSSDIVRSLANTEGLSHVDFMKLMQAQNQYLSSVNLTKKWNYLPQYLAMHDAYNAVDAKYRTYAPITFSTNESQFEVGELAAIQTLEEWTHRFAPPSTLRAKTEFQEFKRVLSSYKSKYDRKTKADAQRLSDQVLQLYLSEQSKWLEGRSPEVEPDLQVVSLKSDIKSFLSRVRRYTFADALRLTAGEALFSYESGRYGIVASSYWLMNVVNEKSNNLAPDLESIDNKPFVLVTRSKGFEDQARSTASGAFTNLDDLFDTKSDEYIKGKKLAEQFWNLGALAPINGANDSKKSYLESR